MSDLHGELLHVLHELGAQRVELQRCAAGHEHELLERVVGQLAQHRDRLRSQFVGGAQEAAPQQRLRVHFLADEFDQQRADDERAKRRVQSQRDDQRVQQQTRQRRQIRQLRQHHAHHVGRVGDRVVQTNLLRTNNLTPNKRSSARTTTQKQQGAHG